MALTTYITTTEANYYYPNDDQFSAGERTNALNTSFGLVNSFINPELKIPVIGVWDGVSNINAPHVLKLAQGQFYKYLLQFSREGYKDELEQFFQAVADKLRGLKQNEIAIPTAQTFSHEVGWHITEKNITNSLGDMELFWSSPAPSYRRFYNLVVTASGYADALTYDVYRDDSSAVLESHTGTYDSWVTIDNSFQIRFMGYLNTNDNFRVVGVPNSDVNASTEPNPVKFIPINYNNFRRE